MLQIHRFPLIPFLHWRDRLTRQPAPRAPEPMAMVDPDAVAEFHAAGEAKEQNAPVQDLSSRALHHLVPEGGRVLDLGSGSGQLLAHLARCRPDLEIVGLELSRPMLELGRRTLEEKGVADRVRLVEGDMTDFADRVAEERIDAISCVWALHHLPDEESLVRCLEQIAAVRERTGCAVWIFDFRRFRRPSTGNQFISVVGRPGPTLRRDAVNSIAASFSEEEMRGALERAGLGDLDYAIPWGFVPFQAAWGERRTDEAWAPGSWHRTKVGFDARVLSNMIRSGFLRWPRRPPRARREASAAPGVPTDVNA